MPYKNINGVKTYYRIYSPKKRTTLVLVHAMSLSSRMWKEQIKEFKKHFKVVVYDARGQGRTESSEGAYSIELFAADLKELCDKLKIKKAHFLGLSMGGMICQQFAINYPEMAEKIVLCDTYHHVTDTMDLFVLDWMEEITKISKKFAGFLTNETQFPRRKEHELYEFFKKEGNNVSKKDQIKLLKAVKKFDVSQHVKEIEVPTLIITGEDETNFHKYEKDMHEQIKNSELRVILGTLHLTNMEKPKEFNKIVLEFLEK